MCMLLVLLNCLCALHRMVRSACLKGASRTGGLHITKHLKTHRQTGNQIIQMTIDAIQATNEEQNMDQGLFFSIRLNQVMDTGGTKLMQTTIQNLGTF